MIYSKSEIDNRPENCLKCEFYDGEMYFGQCMADGRRGDFPWLLYLDCPLKGEIKEWRNE